VLAGRSAGSSKEAVQQRCAALVASQPVMLFMKGSAEAPRCGFSGRVVDALKAAGCSNFGTFDILSDEDVRQGLKVGTGLSQMGGC
jgi:glutaredoxin-related protein